MIRSRPFAPVLALGAAVLSAAAASAQPPPWTEVTFASELRVNAFRYDNFFQAPSGQPKIEVNLTRVEGRVRAKTSDASPFELYARGRFDHYSEGLDEAWAVGTGLRYDTDAHDADVFLHYEKDRPVFDVGDEFDRADVLGIDGQYSWRFVDDWEATALGEWRREEFNRTTGKDNDFVSGGAALRYRGWGYVFSPEVGIELANRDTNDPNEDMDQRDVWIKVRSIPVEGVYLSLRYRMRHRDYSVGDPAASNFDREDDRDDWTLSADYQVLDWLGLNAYVSYEDADSTKASRIFETTLAGIGASFGW